VKPRLKHLTCLSGNESLLVSLDPRTRVELADPTGQILALLMLLRDGSRSIPELHRAMTAKWPDLTPEELQSVVESLDELGWLEDAAAPLLLTDYQRERYFSNLAFFDGFTTLHVSRESIQVKLLNAHVLLLGAGGLGSSVLQNLAGLGVGRVTLLDFDRVELRNLARQFTYDESQVGSSKVHQVAAWARAFSSQMTVTPIEKRVQSIDDIQPLLSGVDLVISAIDQPENIDLIVNDACVPAGVPLVRGGLAYLQGLYWSVNPGRSACRRCLSTYREARALDVDAVVNEWPMVLRPAHPNRATGPVAQMLGSLVSMEAMRYLTGLSAPVAAGAYQLVDFTGDCSISSDPWPADPECATCARRVAA
jgi:molybdopterin/thiamine biosynthesis adenylyltransferase